MHQGLDTYTEAEFNHLITEEDEFSAQALTSYKPSCLLWHYSDQVRPLPTTPPRASGEGCGVLKTASWAATQSPMSAGKKASGKKKASEQEPRRRTTGGSLQRHRPRGRGRGGASREPTLPAPHKWHPRCLRRPPRTSPPSREGALPPCSQTSRSFVTTLREPRRLLSPP